MSNKAFTLSSSNFHTLFDPRKEEEMATVMPTLTAANNPSRSPQSTEVTNQVQVMLEATSTVRRLTPTECERLQGFPDGWTAEKWDWKKNAVVPQADSARYKQMGNAVAVPVVDFLIRRLVEAQ